MGEEASDEATQPELADRLYRYHHTRHLFLSNDRADVAGAPYMMEVVQVMYDTASYLSDEEYEEHGSRVNIQSMVERPYIRILTKSAGGEEEQQRHIPDRLKDLNSAAQDIPREHGGAISDVFVAFTGDMSAWWFEAGVLRWGGSSYKCA